jgi:hypothetical protein
MKVQKDLPVDKPGGMTDTWLIDWLTKHRAELVVASHPFGSYMSLRFDIHGRIFTLSERIDDGDYLRRLISKAMVAESNYEQQCANGDSNG